MSEPTDPLATCPSCRRCREWCGCEPDGNHPRPAVDLEGIRLAREAYARGEGIDVRDVLAELVRENQEWGMYDNPPGPRTGEK